jgi:hypothetical protein
VRPQATYVRLVYTASSADAPRSCRRIVTGLGLYKVTGWHYDTKTIAFLLPTTAINLASLILLVVAMYMGRPVLYSTDPTDPNSLLLATTELRRGNTKVKIELSSGQQHSFWKASGSYSDHAQCLTRPLVAGHVGGGQRNNHELYFSCWDCGCRPRGTDCDQ